MMYRIFDSFERVIASSGKERLNLLHETDEDGYKDFHTLRWEVHTQLGWETKLILTDTQFQGSYPFRRWISDLHSIRNDCGFAVILVAEGNCIEGSPSIDYLYSWRLWDLSKNLELFRIKDCEFLGEDNLLYH